MRKITTIIGFFTLFAGSISAQNINPNVEVKRDYENRLPVIHKSKLSTDFNDSLNNFALNFNYMVFDKSYKDLYEFAPTTSAKIERPDNPHNYTLYARGGVAFPLSPDIFVAYSPKLQGIRSGSNFLSSSNLMIYASHKSFWGDAPLQGIDYGTEYKTNDNAGGKYLTEKLSQKVGAHDSRTEAGIVLGHYWNTGRLGASLVYTNGYNSFYGKNVYLEAEEYKGSYSDVNSHNFNKIVANFNINSLDANKEVRGFNYKANVDYNYLGDNSLEKLKSHYIAAKAEIGPTFGKYSKFLVKLSLRNANTSILDEKSNYGLIEATPTYNLKHGNWQLSLGGTVSLKYTDAAAGKHHTMIIGMAKAQYQLINNVLAVYAVADGGNNLNNYSSLLEQNPWLSPFADCMISSVPVRVTGGITGNISGIVDYDLSTGYAKEKGLLQFINSFENPAAFNILYSNAEKIFFKAAIGVSTKDFTGNLKMQYNRYNGYKPYNYAPFEAKFYGEYNYMQRVFVGLNIYGRNRAITNFVKGYRMVTESDHDAIITRPEYLYDKDSYLKGFVNIGITGRYVINDMLSVYAEIDNLLGQRPNFFQQYYQKGISIGGGVIVKL